MSLLQTVSAIGLAACLASCTSASNAGLNLASPTPGSSPTVENLVQPVAVRTVIVSKTPLPVPTQPVISTNTTTRRTPFPTAAKTATSIALPTLSITPLDPLRKTPPTLMLHRSNPDFDAVTFLEEFVEILQEEQMHVVTYQDLTHQPDLTATEQGRLLIITIDDISLQAKIDPSIQQMIAILRAANYPAVLGIVTEGKLADEETAATLKALADIGWELAMHTDNHTDLHVLEQTSPYGARLEIRTCADKIYSATGVRPITLVLPYGNMVEDLKILYRENVLWVVGIVGGEKYRTTHQMYYVGRDGPAGDAAQTYRAMTTRFGAK